MYWINCFFVYSVLGNLLELLFAYMIGAKAESGFLYGPWTPIYGIAAIIIILISEKLFKNLHMNRLIETIIVCFILTIILTGLEWLGGVLIEICFGYSFWDYTNMKFNLGKYVCLEFALLWSFMSIVFIYIVRPFLDQFVKRIPKFVTFIVIAFFIIDLFLTFMINGKLFVIN